jgi:hypothetical protein
MPTNTQSQTPKGGKNMTTSAYRKSRYVQYKTNHIRERHKIKRILRSSGHAAADVYARARGLSGFLAGLVNVVK